MTVVRHFHLMGQVLSYAMDFLGEAQRSVLVAREIEIKKTKAGGHGTASEWRWAQGE